MSKKRKSNFRDKVAGDVERREKQASSYGYLNLPKGLSIFKVEQEGRIKLDFLPYEVTDENHMDRDDERDIATPGSLWYKKPFRIHRNIGVDNDVVICPTTFGLKCPICEYRKKLMKEDADKEDIKALNYSFRSLYIVIPIGNKKFDEEIHVWDIANGNFQSELDDELREDPDNGIFPDLEEGLTLRIRFNEEILHKNKFYQAGRIDFEKREEQYNEDVLKDVPNLDELLKVLSYEELKTKFMDLDDDDVVKDDPDDDEPVDQVRSTNRTKKSLHRKPPVDEDPDDEEDTDEKPKRSLRRSRNTDDDEPKKIMRRKDKSEPEEDDDDDMVSTRKSSTTRRSSRDKKTNGEELCPYGHRFGIDTDKFEDCETCEKWDPCAEEKDSR